MYERTFSGALGPYFAQIKEISAGGNGRILSGIDTRFDFPVCIKRISVSNKDECRAALREIRIRRRLRHENIVGLLNAIVSDGTDISEITPANFRETSYLFVVQELLDADLRQVIESYTRLSDEYVKLFFYQLLRGLKYIHSANVLHCDLKPSNVMINLNSLQLMIGDFGHSMVLDPEYSHGNSVTVCDTSLWYKAPELILGTDQYSTASDIWAVGCILAEMLLGRPLFEGESDLEQLELIIHAIKVPQKDQAYIRSFLTDEVNTMYSGKPKFPLQLKFQKVDFQALHLLEQILSFNPDNRLTTEQALSDQFLHEYACVADEPVCLKPLHLEHEVDDFLEYTLKDLIVGECIALAEEQPRIHLQMSSYSSLTDITKECHVSPSESASHSTEERSSLELKTVNEDYHNEDVSNESEGNRFKVLEVLKEEHGSSSDSNGLATHEEGVSEAPMVLDHPMFSSSKWEKERHKSGHRRHHHHRRKKKFHLKSPSSETEQSLDSNGRLPRLNSPEEEHSLLPKVEIHSPEAADVPPVTESAVIQAQDDKVQELIMRSRQLIAGQAEVMNEVPAITDICSCSGLTDVCKSITSPVTSGSLSTKSTTDDVCSTLTSNYAPTDICQSLTSKEYSVLPMEIEEKNPDSKVEKNISLSVGDLSVFHRSTVDLGVAEVIRRSQELLGEVSNITEEKSLTTDDPVQDLISRSEQLLKSKDIRELTINESEEKSSVNGSESVKDLISKSEQLLKSNEHLQPVNKQGIVNRCGSEFPIEDKSYNYPPPFTDKSLTTQLPPVNHLVNNPRIHSTVKCNTPFVTSINHHEPVKNTLQSDCIQPMLSDPYHLKESESRMQELLNESHALVNSLKTDLNFEEHSGKIPYEEKCEEVKTNKKENFNKGLNGIDLNEMKLVLDQAKKLLEKSNELSAKESFKVDENAMDVDKNAEEGNEGDYTRMEIDQNVGDIECGNGRDTSTEVISNSGKISDSLQDKNTTEDVLKDFSSFQNQNDFVTLVSEPLAGNEQAVMFEVPEVKLIPPFEKQTTRLNCLTRSKGDYKSTSMSNLSGFGQSRVETNHHIPTGNDSDKQVLVKKRSNETLSETNDDNTNKHFKNCSVTLLDVNLGIEVEQSTKHCFDYDSRNPQLNGFHTDSLDLNVDTRLIADSSYKTDSVSRNQVSENECKPEENSPKHETSTPHNRDTYSVIEHLNSDEVVDKLCGNTCRMKNNTKIFNSKESTTLQNLYTTLKLKSIMRSRTRPRREKHDTYPF